MATDAEHQSWAEKLGVSLRLIFTVQEENQTRVSLTSSFKQHLKNQNHLKFILSTSLKAGDP